MSCSARTARSETVVHPAKTTVISNMTRMLLPLLHGIGFAVLSLPRSRNRNAGERIENGRPIP